MNRSYATEQQNQEWTAVFNQDANYLQTKRVDQLLYLELTNFHSITKGEEWDVQDLESIYSKLDSKQHELLARIQDVIQEDIARGQTVKHSH